MFEHSGRFQITTGNRSGKHEHTSTKKRLRLFRSRFSVTIRSDENTAYFWLLVDEQRAVYNDCYMSAASPTCSVTVNLQLTEGQLIRVENNQAGLVLGTNELGWNSWFTGHLLYVL